MKRGYLSEHFEGVALKRLSAVEADTSRSNQHEYNATRDLLQFMGRPSEPARLPTRFIYLNDEDAPVVEDAFLTLYDARQNHPTRSEYRFYFPTTDVSELAAVNDLLAIAKMRDGGMLVIVAESNSTAARQLEWMFGYEDDLKPSFEVRLGLEEDRDRIGLAASFILENLGFVPEPEEEKNYLDEMLAKFGNVFPKTKPFSEYARSTLSGIDPRDDPDAALMAWLEREEALFRTFERHVVKERLEQGFSAERIEEFIAFSLSVQNRRKSRAGHSLEHHMEVVLHALKIRYKKQAVTENRTKPDFLFPGQVEYHDQAFSPLLLSMLAVKSSCKDRWRQALAEADKIPDKHLLTLETAISVNQTDEMKAKCLQLVVPRALHQTYNAAQQSWLFDVRTFANFVLAKQA